MTTFRTRLFILAALLATVTVTAVVAAKFRAEVFGEFAGRS